MPSDIDQRSHLKRKKSPGKRIGGDHHKRRFLKRMRSPVVIIQYKDFLATSLMRRAGCPKIHFKVLW